MEYQIHFILYTQWNMPTSDKKQIMTLEELISFRDNGIQSYINNFKCKCNADFACDA